MAQSPDIVVQLNAAARASGAADSVLQFENLATQAQYRRAYDVASRYVRAGQSVLDWGCGNGHFSFFLDSLGADVTGYSFEAPPASMRCAKHFRFVAGSESDPRSLPFADASFDTIVGVGVLEHVWETGGDEPSSLAELARVLKPGGALLTFHLPNKSGLIEKVTRRLWPSKHFHHRKFDEAEIRALWTNAGLSIDDLGLYNALPRAELRRLPTAIRHSPGFMKLYDAIDDGITRIAPSVATNYWIAARKSPLPGR